MYRSIPPSSTLLLNEQSETLEKTGRQVFRFGFGQSPFPVAPILRNALVEFAHHKEYTSVQGLASLREQVAKYHSSFEQRSITQDQVFVAPGSKALLYTIMSAYSHAAILIPAPAWVSYAPQAELIGHCTFFMQTDYSQRYRITAEKLESTLNDAAKEHKTLLVVLNSPGNPDGLCYSETELKSLAKVLKKYDALVISDEIYGPLQHDNQHVSLAKYYPQGTFVTSGLSKWAGAGGWRLGVAILPENYDEKLKHAMLGIASETYSCAAAPIQHAAITAYSPEPEMEQYTANQRIILKAIGNKIHEALIDAGLRAHPPQGGFYMLVDFSHFREELTKLDLTCDSAVCSHVLQQTGVALLPGAAFGLPAESLCARLAYVDFSGSQALDDLAQFGWSDELTEKHTKKMRQGISLLAKFLVSMGK